ncbi:bestrophin family protein [Aquabacterium sp.]|uniref:bestrophin family protein n=1 Tax=Aquabacterium sp. TaxID=1872578 RepID=UPI002E2FADDA|nr:bestrophin family ion channel [Aquabacterium sp.]HEX5310936.1 bestrophin family ion channel [Aquabacterium sp.]
MIVRPRPNWLRMLFVRRGSILKKVLPQLGVITALSILVVIFHGELLHWKVTLTTVPFSLVGVALAIFLGFRNSASYDRYWEARKLWGKLLTDSRNATRQYLTFIGTEARPFVLGLAAYVHAVRHQLRNTDPTRDMQRLLPAELMPRLANRQTPPLQIMMWLSECLRQHRLKGELDAILASELDKSLTGLNDAFGGCERIAYTPLPFTYSVILHRTVYLYCFMLPFGLLDAIGFMTPVMVAFVAYTFFAIEALSDEIEEPFGLLPNDLALDAMATNIESALLEMLGDRELPKPVEPVNFLLT